MWALLIKMLATFSWGCLYKLKQACIITHMYIHKLVCVHVCVCVNVHVYINKHICTLSKIQMICSPMMMDDTWLPSLDAPHGDISQRKNNCPIFYPYQLVLGDMFIRGLAKYLTINLSKFTKNLMEHMVNSPTFLNNDCFFNLLTYIVTHTYDTHLLTLIVT